MNHTKVKSIVESLLFLSTKPLSPKQIKKKLPEIERSVIEGVLNELYQDYQDRNGGFFLAEVSGGFQFRTPPENKEWVKRAAGETSQTMTRATLETLTIIAYKQPLIRSDIEHIRGVDSGGTIKNLLDMKLIRVFGRKNIPGRPLIYTTTNYFLEFFNLKSIADLPTLGELEPSGSSGDSSGKAKP